MSKKSFTFKAPAKINLGLRILSKRKDGYHNLETIFYPIPLYDTIKVSINKISGFDNKISVTTIPAGLVGEKENICFKAAELFLSKIKSKVSYEIKITIQKRIPVGAGLGGGSSDAAAVLKILYEYLKKYITDVNNLLLKKLALTLGSDVPFFLLNKPAYAYSRGEKLRVLTHFNINYDILLVYPGIHISTKWAFEKLKLSSNKKKLFHLIKSFTGTSGSLLCNDFEKVVFEKYKEIGKIKDTMYNNGAVFSLMSGSGSCVYGLFRKNIQPAFEYFKKLGYKVYILRN